MRAVYVVDRKGTLWFSHVTDVHVRRFHGADMHVLLPHEAIEGDDESRVPPASIREKSLYTSPLHLNSIESGGACQPVNATTTRHPGTQKPTKTETNRWLVASELKRVLAQAIEAGASIEELFLHFDQLNRG